ncbi:MAG TPA: antitoxin [Nocardioides sp.]|jgi:hypothetical protein|nr:antitoxin [Nocardioides sp.]
MTDKPQDPSSSDPSDRPPLAEQIRAKMEEYEVDRHLNELATTLEGAVRQGLHLAGDFAHEHRGDLERLFEKVASAVDTRTDGKHADTIHQVRGSLERGVDKIVEQRNGGTPGASGDDVPPSNG